MDSVGICPPALNSCYWKQVITPRLIHLDKNSQFFYPLPWLRFRSARLQILFWAQSHGHIMHLFHEISLKRSLLEIPKSFIFLAPQLSPIKLARTAKKFCLTENVRIWPCSYEIPFLCRSWWDWAWLCPRSPLSFTARFPSLWWEGECLLQKVWEVTTSTCIS